MLPERSGAYQVVRRVEECERGCAGRFSVERCCRWPGRVGEVGDGLLTLFLCGDVMTGRGTAGNATWAGEDQRRRDTRTGCSAPPGCDELAIDPQRIVGIDKVTHARE